MSTSLRDAVRPACEAVSAALDRPEGPVVDLTGPTPCEHLDLRALVEHVVGTSAALARLGLGEPLDATDPWGGGAGAADGDWPGRLRANLDAVARGWSREEAWTGDDSVGGSTMPRSMLGEMALIEVAVHGWDLARATGRRVELPEAVAEAVRQVAATTAELGRQMRAYGPEVPVPDGATALDRALGLVGRDPGWSV